MTQKRFRRHDDQRLAEVAVDLAAQRVEIIGWRRQVHDLHIVFGAHLQEALKACRTVLRTLAFIAMRQKADETAHPQPFTLCRGNELVKEDLRPVREVAKLRFPEGQAVRIGQRIAVLIAKHRLFGEKRVDDFIVCLAFAQIVERRVARARFLIDEVAVALREGAAPGILTREADRETLIEQGRKGKMFCRRPIEALAGLDRFAAAIDDPAKRLVNVDILRDRRDRLAELFQLLDRNAGLAAALIILRQAEAFPFTIQPVGLGGFECLAIVKGLVEEVLEILDLRGNFVLGHQALLNEAGSIDLTGRLMALDLGVHDRLGEHRFVTLIVAEPAIAEHVDDDVLAEFLPVLGRDLRAIGDRFRVISIHVEDRCLHHQRNV